MPLTRDQVVARIEVIADQLNKLMNEIKAAPAAPAAGSAATEVNCPIHNIPWVKTTSGLGHRIHDGSRRWCFKVVAKPAGR